MSGRDPWSRVVKQIVNEDGYVHQHNESESERQLNEQRRREAERRRQAEEAARRRRQQGK